MEDQRDDQGGKSQFSASSRQMLQLPDLLIIFGWAVLNNRLWLALPQAS